MPFCQPPLTETWRQLKRLLDSGRYSALTPTERAEWLTWAELHAPECAIEIAMVNASAKQLKFQKAFFERRDEKKRHCDVYVALGANRSGKSYVAGNLCFALWLRDYAKGGGWYWCVGQTLQRSIGGQQQEIWNALPRWMFGDQIWEPKGGFGSGSHAKLLLPTQDGGKCLIEFRSADQDLSTFEQAKLDGVWIDERLDEARYGRLIPRIVDKNGFILYSDIPEQFWQFQRLAEAPPEAGVYFQHFQMLDNAHNLPDGAIVKASARMNEDERRQKILGQFLVMEGIVYSQYIDAIHAVDDFPHGPGTMAARWPRWRLIDYGGSAPTAGLWVMVAPDETVFFYREHYERNLSIPRNARMIINGSAGEQYVDNLIDPHAIDKPPAYYGSSPTVAEQYAQAGIKTKGWPYINVIGEHACVQTVKKRLEDRKLFVFKSCANLRREFRSWTYKLDAEGRPKATDVYDNQNNHLLDCVKGFLASKPTYTQLRSTSDRRQD